MLNVQNYSYYRTSDIKLSKEELNKNGFIYVGGCNAIIKSIRNNFLYIAIEKRNIDYIVKESKLSLDEILNKYKLFTFEYNYETDVILTGESFYVFELSLKNFNNNQQRYYGFCMIRHLYYYQNFLINYLKISSNLKEKNHIKVLSFLQGSYGVPHTFIPFNNYTNYTSFNELLKIFVKQGNFIKNEYNTIGDSSLGNKKRITLKDVARNTLKLKELDIYAKSIKDNIYISLDSRINISEEDFIEVDDFRGSFNRKYYLIKNQSIINKLKNLGIKTTLTNMHLSVGYFSITLLYPEYPYSSIIIGDYFYSIKTAQRTNFRFYNQNYNNYKGKLIASVNGRFIRKNDESDIILNPLVNQKNVNTKLRRQKIIDSVPVTCKAINHKQKFINLWFSDKFLFACVLNDYSDEKYELPEDIIKYCKQIWDRSKLDIGYIVYDTQNNIVVDISVAFNVTYKMSLYLKNEIKRLIQNKGGVFPIN